MKLNCIYLLCVIVAAATVKAQNEGELEIPVENDNQFPPEKHSDVEGHNDIEGSGAGVIEEPTDPTSELPPVAALGAPLEEFVPTDTTTTETPSGDEFLCPQPCVCNTEGDPQNYVVDCYGYDLTEFPTTIDSKTTILNLQKNKLTEIPKEISTLKNLKVLNANDNSIMNLAAGSVSELSELTELQLENNRLIEYPQDLKNSFGLTKLKVLNLGGNDIRTTLTTDTFKNFNSLNQLILPQINTEFAQELCASVKDTLESVCIDSCSTKTIDCPESMQNIEEEFNSVLPGTLSSPFDKEEDPAIDSANAGNDDVNLQTEETTQKTTEAANNAETSSAATVTETFSVNNDKINGSEFSFRSAINKVAEGAAQLNAVVDVPTEITSSTESEVKVGAKTSETKTGGVDKSIIGMIVAGMVVVVAGITIKKNWSSIRKRFSSNPSPANERATGTANGTTPEEVPLQDKSPV